MANGGETLRHRELKRLAIDWAQANGFGLCAPEVRVPRSGFRADVAAASRGTGRRTVVFECKQSRSDLLKDASAEEATRRRLAELADRQRTLEDLFRLHRPDLRAGDALWPEYDTWDFARIEHATYHGVLADIALEQRRIIRGTKFSKMLRYRCADFLYLVVEDAIFAEAEIPAGWGLLVRRGDTLELRRRSTDLDAAESQRIALLEAIAAAGTRAFYRAAGIVPPAPGAADPDLLPGIPAPDTPRVGEARRLAGPARTRAHDTVDLPSP